MLMFNIHQTYIPSGKYMSLNLFIQVEQRGDSNRYMFCSILF